MSSYWCELAWLGDDGVLPGVLIEVEGEGIVSVAARMAATPEAIRLPGLTLPGLANAHSHCFQRALRGRTEAPAGGSFWTWREEMYTLAERLDESRFEALARATFGEMALAGITLVGEFDYIHYSDAVMRAATGAGVRLTLIDACYLHGGLSRFRDAGAAEWAHRVSQLTASGTVRLAAAIHSVRAVDPDSAAVVAVTAAERGWPLHAHVSEQPAENEDCLARHGVSPLQLLQRVGAVSSRLTAIHATHFSAEDAQLLRDADAFCCLCPTTERDLADGIGTPHGRLTLGSDSQAVIDLFEEARAVELNERLRTRVRGTHGAGELAAAMTRNGYASLGWPEGGSIAVGQLADLISVRLDGVRLAGTMPEDALDSVVFAASAADVDTVIVGGRTIVRGGAHVEIDVAAELSTAIAAVSA